MKALLRVEWSSTSIRGISNASSASDLNGGKVKGALKCCPASKGYTQQAEPPVLLVTAASQITQICENVP